MAHRRSPIAAGVLCVLVACAAGLSVAHADDGWHDGWCAEGEGQSVVVDWSTPEATGPTSLVRCIVLAEDATAYPVDVYPLTVAVLESAHIPYKQKGGVVTSINGVAAPTGGYWHFSVGEVGADGGRWLPKENWNPGPEQKFVGMKLLPQGGGPFQPVEIPRYAEPAPTDGPGEPTKDPSGPPTDNPGAPTKDPSGPPTDKPSAPTKDPSGPPTDKPSPRPSGTPTVVPPPVSSPDATPPPKEVPASRPSATAEPSTSRPPQRSTPPSRPPSPSATRPPEPSAPEPSTPPTPTPASTPSPAGEATANASASPTAVWGREDVRAGAPADDTPATTDRWAGLTGVAAGTVLLGALGWVFRNGLAARRPHLEDE